MGVVGIVRCVVAGAWRAEGQQVTVGGGGVEHLERRQFDALSPSGVQDEVVYPSCATVLPEDIPAVETWRQAAHGAVVRAADECDVVAQSGRQLECRQLGDGDAHFLLGIECHVVQCRQLVVAVFAPGRCIAHVFIVGAAPVVAAGSPFCTGHQPAQYAAEAVSPVAFQPQRVVQRLAVVIAPDVPVARRTEDDACLWVGIIAVGHQVALLGGVDVGLCRGTAGMLVVLRATV